MSPDDIDPDILEVLIQERSRGRRGLAEETKHKRERLKLASELVNAMRGADVHGFSDALRNAGIVEGSPAWKNAWTAYYAFQNRR